MTKTEMTPEEFKAKLRGMRHWLGDALVNYVEIMAQIDMVGGDSEPLRKELLSILDQFAAFGDKLVPALQDILFEKLRDAGLDLSRLDAHLLRVPEGKSVEEVIAEFEEKRAIKAAPNLDSDPTMN